MVTPIAARHRGDARRAVGSARWRPRGPSGPKRGRPTEPVGRVRRRGVTRAPGGVFAQGRRARPSIFGQRTTGWSRPEVSPDLDTAEAHPEDRPSHPGGGDRPHVDDAFLESAAHRSGFFDRVGPRLVPLGGRCRSEGARCGGARCEGDRRGGGRRGRDRGVDLDPGDHVHRAGRHVGPHLRGPWGRLVPRRGRRCGRPGLPRPRVLPRRVRRVRHTPGTRGSGHTCVRDDGRP